MQLDPFERLQCCPSRLLASNGDCDNGIIDDLWKTTVVRPSMQKELQELVKGIMIYASIGSHIFK